MIQQPPAQSKSIIDAVGLNMFDIMHSKTKLNIWDRFQRLLLLQIYGLSLFLDFWAQYQLRVNSDFKDYADAHLANILIPLCMSALVTMFTCFQAPEVKENGVIFRVIYQLFQFLGFDAVLIYIYTIYKGETWYLLESRLLRYDNGRKSQIYYQAIPNTFVCICYVFYVPNNIRNVVIAAYFFNGLNAVTGLTAHSISIYDHNNSSMVQCLRNNLFTSVFWGQLGEILGRTIFVAGMIMNTTDNAIFQTTKPYILCIEFLIWDGIALGGVCFIMFIVYYCQNKSFVLSFQHFLELFFGAAITRPCFDNDSMHQHEELGHIQAMMTNDYNFQRHAITFPIIWRIAEYISICILIVDNCYIRCDDGRPRITINLFMFSSVLNIAYFAFLIYMFFRSAFHIELFSIFHKQRKIQKFQKHLQKTITINKMIDLQNENIANNQKAENQSESKKAAVPGDSQKQYAEK